MNPKRPVVRYPGGKWRIAKWIIEHFPAHFDFFVENPCGAANILMNLPRKKGRGEIINDINDDMINVFEILRDKKKSKELQRLLTLTPFSYTEYQKAYEPTRSKLEWARRVIFRSYASIGADGLSRGRAGFRALKNYESALTTAHEWENYPKELKAFCLRLSGVVIDNRDVTRVIEVYDSPKTLFYVDLPYLMDARKQSKKLYKNEITEEKHIEVAEKLHEIQGMAIISHYDHPLYRELYADWNYDSCEARIQGNGPSVEFIWISPNIEPKQPKLF